MNTCAVTPDMFKHLQAVLAAELRSYCKTLLTEQESAMERLKAALDEQLRAETKQREDFAKQLQRFQNSLQCLEGDLSNMDSRLIKTASQQVSAHAEHQTFENHAIAVFDSLEESLQEVHNKLLQLSTPPCNSWFAAKPEQTCHNLVVHGPEDNGGQPQPPPASYAPTCATGIGSRLATEQCEARPEAPITVEVREATLSSMQEHEHEQVRCSQARFSDL